MPPVSASHAQIALPSPSSVEYHLKRKGRPEARLESLTGIYEPSLNRSMIHQRLNMLTILTRKVVIVLDPIRKFTPPQIIRIMCRSHDRRKFTRSIVNMVCQLQPCPLLYPTSRLRTPLILRTMFSQDLSERPSNKLEESLALASLQTCHCLRAMSSTIRYQTRSKVHGRGWQTWTILK